MLFERNGGGWQSVKDQSELTVDFLYSYKDDFILQEAIKQHDDIARLGSTSVNTLRVTTYRSVKDEQVHIIGSVIRIGKTGAIVDNDFDSSVFAGVDLQTGKIGNFVSNYYGFLYDEWNGVMYPNNDFYIPSWDKVLDLVMTVANSNHHCRLLAFDICVDSDGNPKMLEYNVTGFSYWYFMLTGRTAFGKYLDEILEYCKNVTDQGKRRSVMRLIW